MRCNNEYKALISKINVKKTNYSEKEMVVSNELEHDIQLTKEKSKKYSIWVVVASAVMVFVAGKAYDILDIINAKWVMWLVIGVCLAIFIALMVLDIIFKVKLKRLEKKKLAEDTSKDKVQEDIVSLNDQIATLVVCVIVLNEHFYELASIENDEELERVWDKYIKEATKAINIKYNYHPTYTEFEEYYHNYEYNLEEKES